jgi:hypothetical protein
MGVTVVHTTLTKHILGAIDLTGPPGPPASRDRLVGAALPLRLGRASDDDVGKEQAPRVLVPAEQLATAAAERVAGLLDGPMAFGIGPGRTPTPLSPWKAGSKPVELKTTGITITLDRTSTAQPTPVLVVLAGSDGDQTLTGEVTEITLVGQVFAGRKLTTIGVALKADAWYTVLTLAAGWHGRLEALRATS